MSRIGATVTLAALLLGAAIASCGGGTSSTSQSVSSPAATSPPPTPPPPTRSPTPTPSPAPDDERVLVTETGVGAYLETTYPVAIVRSAAGAHAARQVTVHLVVVAGSRHLGAVDARIDSIAPGATVAVTSRLQAPATAGETVTATVTVGAWDDGAGPPPVATLGAATFSCPRCGSGAASGDVLATLTAAPGLPAATPVGLVSVCRSASGAIVGGGAQLFVPPAGAGGIQADVPTVVSSRPATCSVSAGAVSI